ncbi:MAG: helix-turn-helix domain-containing protein [Deltaproteobacteria bacterium]|nr:helix-turn-helix domain-containing protein [Deltaproteobacteria bacterium]
MVKVKASTSDLVTVSQAAALLKTTRQNIHAAIQRGRLPATRVGAILLIERAALDAYAKSRAFTGRPPKKKIK